MNPIAEETVNILKHEGVSILDGAPGRGSGRYPLGSGENPNQHRGSFYTRVQELRKEGLSDTEIAKSMGLSTTKFRAEYTIAKNEKRTADIATARSLLEQGYNKTQIAQMMGLKGESTVRSLLNEQAEARMNAAQNTAEFLKKVVSEKGMVDVGIGVERELGDISREKLEQALHMLELEGYEVYGVGVPQVTNPGKQTNIKVLCPPGTKHSDVYNFENIHSVGNYATHDGGETFDAFQYPKSMDGKRLQIRYAEEGGKEKDGVIELRRGVKDLSLGNSHYAQVRILVDDTKYLKGMALYSDDMPDGVDVIFNTNKKKGTPKTDVLKDIKNDPDNPFGSLIKANGQSYYIDENGKKQLSLINKRAEEGDWDEWSNHLSSQFLAKQSTDLVKRQLNLATADKKAEYDEICSLTNPTVKKALLKSFADDCDSAAVHLKAAALPRQRYQVILPLTKIKDNEVYAPNYKDGEKVALIRYPHAGTFEIPILTVNNRNAEGKRIIGRNPLDAIGINSKVAERLSGADFDGDTVMVIPTNEKVHITSTKPLEGLRGFDPQMAYPKRDGMKIMSKGQTQTEMGIISNLITDMTIKGATEKELARAVRHSMVVIDANKHSLDYKLSEAENGIKELKRKYQGHIKEDGSYAEGSATLISRAKGKAVVLKRKGQPWINSQTGELEWERINPKTGKLETKIRREEYTDERGKKQLRTQDSTHMAETKDARTLSSGYVVEELYADYANGLKALANTARKEMINTGNLKYSAEAKKKYNAEVLSLSSKLAVAEKNAPRERLAQIMANSEMKAKKQENPDMEKSEKKKLSQQALARARINVGAKRMPVDITDSEWEAIQAGAISENVLSRILTKTDIDQLKERSMPRTRTTLSEAKINKIKAMSNSGYTNEEIAEAIGKSVTTVIKYLKD